MSALSDATISSTADIEAEAGGGSTFGGGTSLAANGVIVTNTLQGDTLAYVTDSDMQSDGDIQVDADSTMSITASNSSLVSSGETSVGFLAAFNTIGYDSQNILFNAMDAILGSNIGDQSIAETKAYVEDAEMVSTGGQIAVAANSANEISSEVNSDATTAASAFGGLKKWTGIGDTNGAEGVAASAVIASNMISSETHAYVKNYNISSVDHFAGFCCRDRYFC